MSGDRMDTGSDGQGAPASQAERAPSGLEMFAKPEPMSESERQRIIREYEKNFADVLGKRDGKPPDPKRVHFLDSEKGRGPNPEERAAAHVHQMETSLGRPLTDEEAGIIWDYEMTNDGLVERLREWAQGRDAVPVGPVNQLLDRLQTVAYDAAAEEARLRAVMRRDHDEMQALLDQCERNCAKEREDVKVAALAQVTSQHLKTVVGRMDKTAREQDDIVRSDSAAPGEDATSSEMAREKTATAWREAHDRVVRAIAEREKVDEAVDRVTEDAPLETRMKALRNADEQVRDAIDKLRTLARTRYVEYLQQDRGKGSSCSSRQHKLGLRYGQLGQDEKSLEGLWQSLAALASKREATRAELRHLRRSQQPGPTAAQMHSLTQSRELMETKRECERLKFQLSEREFQLAKLEKAIDGFRNDDVAAAVKSVQIYRDLVEIEVRNRWSDKVGRLVTQASTVRRLDRSFEKIGQILDELGREELQVETARIASGLVGVSTGIGQLVDDLRKTGRTIHDERRKLWDEADCRAAVEEKDRQIAEMKRKIEGLEAGKRDITDSEGIRKLLESEGGQRERGNQLAGKYEETLLELQQTQGRLEALQRDKEMVEEHARRLQAALRQPSNALKELKRQEELCREEKQRADDAEAAVEQLKRRLEEASAQKLRELHTAIGKGGQETRDGAAEAKLRDELRKREKQIRMMMDEQAEKEESARLKLQVLQKEVGRWKKAQETWQDREAEMEEELAEYRDELDVLRMEMQPSLKTVVSPDQVTLKQRVLDEFDIDLDTVVQQTEAAKDMEDELYLQLEKLRRERDDLEEELHGARDALAQQEKLSGDLLEGNGGLRRELMEADRNRDGIGTVERAELERYNRIVAAAKDHVDQILNKKARGEDGAVEGLWRQGERKTVAEVLEIFSEDKSRAAYSGEDGGRVGQLSAQEIDAHWKLLSFLDLRQHVIRALEQRDVAGMKSRLVTLDRWFADSGDWHQYFTRSSIDVSRAYLWATAHVLEAKERYRQGSPKWERSVEMAVHKMNEGEEMERDDQADTGMQDSTEPLAGRLWSWLRHQLETVLKGDEFSSPPRRSCACRAKPAYCRMHRDPTARKDTRFYHLAQVDGPRVDLLLQESAAKDLEPFNVAV